MPLNLVWQKEAFLPARKVFPHLKLGSPSQLNLIRKKARRGTIDTPPSASRENDIASSAVFAAIPEKAVVKEMSDIAPSVAATKAEMASTREKKNGIASSAATAVANMEIMKWMNDIASSVAATKAEMAITREKMNDIASSVATAKTEMATEKSRLLVSESTTQPLPCIGIDNFKPCVCGEFNDNASTASTSTTDSSSYSGDSKFNDVISASTASTSTSDSSSYSGNSKFNDAISASTASTSTSDNSSYSSDSTHDADDYSRYSINSMYDHVFDAPRTTQFGSKRLYQC